MRCSLKGASKMAVASRSHLPGLDNLDKPELLAMLQTIARQVPEARAIALLIVRRADGGIADRGGLLLARAFKDVLDKRIKALKPSLLHDMRMWRWDHDAGGDGPSRDDDDDDDGEVNEEAAVEVVWSMLTDKTYACTGVPRVRMLCQLAKCLQNLSPQGGAISSEADEVLQSMDYEMRELLEARPARDLRQEVGLLEQVVGLFSEDACYGIFDGVHLVSGDAARALLDQDSSDEDEPSSVDDDGAGEDEGEREEPSEEVAPPPVKKMRLPLEESKAVVNQATNAAPFQALNAAPCHTLKVAPKQVLQQQAASTTAAPKATPKKAATKSGKRRMSDDEAAAGRCHKQRQQPGSSKFTPGSCPI